MMELRSVGVLSCGKFGGVFGALGGLIAVGFMMLFMTAAQNMPIQGPDGQVINFPAGAAAGAGIGFLIFAPIMYGIMGFIGGLFYGFMYNVVAGMIGGIEMNFERVGEHYEPQDNYS